MVEFEHIRGEIAWHFWRLFQNCQLTKLGTLHSNSKIRTALGIMR